MGHEALAWNMTLALPTPTLDDTASDWARLERAMQPYVRERPVEQTLDARCDLGSAPQRGAWQARATLVERGEGWRVVPVGPAREALRTLGLAVDSGTTTIADEEPLTILVDIGTNGETVLGHREFQMACSGSAGSAFEGCGLEWGMAAQPDAIERVWVEDCRLVFRTVGGERPRGICGSGLIEALGAVLQNGAIDRSGKVNLGVPNARRREGHPEVVLAAAPETAVGRDLALRQGDIENLIRDKAALYAGSRILLANASLSFNDVERILIAGNFGQSLEIEQAVLIGLLPDVPRERIQFIGNSSLAGARAALLSRAAWQRAGEIAAAVTCLELTAEPRYFDEYSAALFSPHTDLSQFPSLN